MSTDNYGTFNIGENVETYLEKLGPSPIVSKRNPTARDKAPIGQLWINRTANTAYFLTQITANQAVWSQAASVVGNLTIGGTITAGTGLVVSAGNVDIAAGTLTVSSTITNTLGNITATAGNIVSALGDFHAVNGNIYTDAGDIFTTAGNIEATLGDITATAGDLNMTLGDINMVDGDIIFTAATTGITLPGGPRIVSGAGAPAGAMAQGSLYIRTDGGADTILYVESDGAGTWLAFNTL